MIYPLVVESKGDQHEVAFLDDPTYNWSVLPFLGKWKQGGICIGGDGFVEGAVFSLCFRWTQPWIFIDHDRPWIPKTSDSSFELEESLRHLRHSEL